MRGGPLRGTTMQFHMRGNQRREKLFGYGRTISARPKRQGARHDVGAGADAPDRSRPALWRDTAKHVAVLGALLWQFHNAGTGPMLPVI